MNRVSWAVVSPVGARRHLEALVIMEWLSLSHNVLVAVFITIKRQILVWYLIVVVIGTDSFGWWWHCTNWWSGLSGWTLERCDGCAWVAYLRRAEMSVLVCGCLRNWDAGWHFWVFEELLSVCCDRLADIGFRLVVFVVDVCCVLVQIDSFMLFLFFKFWIEFWGAIVLFFVNWRIISNGNWVDSCTNLMGCIVIIVL